MKEQKFHMCSICASAFSSKYGLDRHMAAAHEGQKPFMCITCGICFGLEKDLKKHVASLHEGKN